jgi:undecaprenyl-diphosphatase
MTQTKHKRLNFFVLTAAVFLLALAAVSYFYFDSYISSKIFNTHRELDMSFFVKIIKPWGKTYVPLWLVFLYGIIKKQIEIILSCSIALLLTLAVVGPLKTIIGKDRPNMYYANLDRTQAGNSTVDGKSYFYGLHKPASQSFPSGDTATIFAISAALAMFVPECSFVILLFAGSAVGFLRILGLAHYPSDVIVGAVIGIVCGWIATTICEKWLEKNKFPFGTGWRNIAAIGIILIPSLDVMSKGFKDLYLFMLSSILLAGCFCVAMVIQQILCKNTK